MKDGGPGEGEAARQEQALGGQNASPPGAISGRATDERSEVSHTLRLQQTHLKHFGLAVYRYGKTLKVHFDFDLLKSVQQPDVVHTCSRTPAEGSGGGRTGGAEKTASLQVCPS